jgi:hypothetical protein
LSQDQIKSSGEQADSTEIDKANAAIKAAKQVLE